VPSGRIGISLYNEPLSGSGRYPVDERDNTVHIVTREEILQFTCQALRSRPELFQLDNRGLYFRQGVILAAASRRSRKPSGVTVIWMNRRGLPTDPGVFCHAQISGIRELLTLLGMN